VQTNAEFQFQALLTLFNIVILRAGRWADWAGFSARERSSTSAGR
jgi:hypothetical protein